MKNKNINLMQLEIIAEALGDVLPQVTFLGGCATVLLVDQAAHYGVRETDDVDVIVDVVSKMDYYRLSDKLRHMGFREDSNGPICRWVWQGKTGIVKLDVMPTDREILGFSNRWYKDAIRTAIQLALPNGLEINVVTPACFLATKFEAFEGRGKGDYFSHDLEDIVFVLENRSGLILELINVEAAIKEYLGDQARRLLNDAFLNVLPGLLNNPDAYRAIVNTLNIMSEWSKK